MQSAKLLLLAAVLVISMSLMGCQTTTSIGGTNCIPCEGVSIIEPSKKDTNGTLKQIYIRNKVYEEFCETQKEEK